MTVKEAAEKMGVTPQLIRLGLQQKVFPFGAAVKFRRRYSYYINEQAFKNYLEGRLIDDNRTATP